LVLESKFKDTQAESISSLLVSKTLPLQSFKVPRFQRNFAWTDEQVEKFWNDIYENYTNYKDTKVTSGGDLSNLVKSQYMLGPVVLRETSEKDVLEWRVIDGQQRLATLTILFCVIRDIIYDLNPPSKENNQRPLGYEESRELIEQYYKGKSYGWKLKLNLADRNFFEERIQKLETPQEKIRKWKENLKDKNQQDTFILSHKKLMKTYEFLYERILDALLTNFEAPFEQSKIKEEKKKSILDAVSKKIVNYPANYELDDKFFGEDWNGKKFNDKTPQNDEELKSENKEFERINSRKRGKKFASVNKFRRYKAEQKQKKFERILKKESDEQIPQTYRTTYIQNLVELPNFLDTVITDNFVVSVRVNDESDAFQIFETLNARGKTLSKSELIKNMCLRLIKNDDTAISLNEKWNKIFDDLIGEGQPDDVFIRESMRSRFFDEHELQGISNKKVSASIANLFRIIKEMVTTEEKVKSYIDNLEKDALFIRQLNNPEQYRDKAETGDEITALKSLGAGHIRLPIISANRRWNFNDDFKDFLQFIVKFHFRNRTIGQIAPGLLESWMIPTAKMIAQKTDETTYTYNLDEIKNFLRDKNIDDETFEFLFNRYEVNDTSIGKYILLQIEYFLSENISDVKPVDDLTVEHILPQNPDKTEWNETDFFNDWNNPNRLQKFESFIPLIGNLTLLRQELNSKLKNKGFKTKITKGYDSASVKLELMKQTVLNMSNIMDDDDKQQLPELNNNIQEWTARIIEKRTERFGKMAKDIWDLS